MKRLLFLLPLLLIATTAYTNPVAHAENNDEVYIIAYRIPEDGQGNRTVYVETNQPIVLGARWGTCTGGLAQGWFNDANVYYEIDETPVLPDAENSGAYWQRPVPFSEGNPAVCIPHTDTIWMAYWRFPYGTLSPGSHQGYMRYWANHQIVDGADVDGDGKVDRYGGVLAEVWFTIVVE